MIVLKRVIFRLSIFGLLAWHVVGQSGEPLSLNDLAVALSRFQHRASWFRDRCAYQQKLYIARYKTPPVDKGVAPFYQRLSIAEVKAERKEEGKEAEVIARLTYDTDSNLQPKEVKSSSRNIFGAPGFLELLLFPYYPENIKFYEVMDLGEADVDSCKTRMVRMSPRPGVSKQPLIEGVFYVDPTSGAPVRLKIDRLHNFDALDSKLKDLIEFRMTVDFRKLPNGIYGPYKASGSGFSKVTRWDGYFKFYLNEWSYVPNEEYPEVNKWFEGMADFHDGPPDDPNMPPQR